MSVMRSFATAPKQIGLGPGSRVMQRKTVVRQLHDTGCLTLTRTIQVLGQAATSLLREHSRGNNLVSSQVGLGASCSYSALVGKAKWGTKPLAAPQLQQASAPGPPSNTSNSAPAAVLQRAPRILPVLSKTCMGEARKLAATDEYPTTYDNARSQASTDMSEMPSISTPQNNNFVSPRR